MSKIQKRFLLGFAAAAAVLGAATGYFTHFYPLEANELSNRIALWRGGVVETEIAGLHTYVQDACGGKKDCQCVALIHGLADDAMTWKRLLLFPTNGWTQPVKLYAFDLPGSGHSPAPADLKDYSVRQQAQAVIRALRPTCPSWTVVGNSLGGWIAAWVALDWSESVNKLMLVDSAGLKSDSSDKLSTFIEPTVESLKDFQKRAYFKPRELSDSIWQAAVARMRRSNARQIVAARTDEDWLDARLPSLHRPTLIFWGASDRVVPMTQGQQMHALIAGSIWREVPQCGHLPQKECPLELIKALSDVLRLGLF